MTSETPTEDDRLPSFVIGGAMKAASTTLHRLLARHPDIEMPHGETHAMSLDDITEHWIAWRHPGGGWRDLRYEDDDPRLLSLYRSALEPLPPAIMYGIDAPVYLSSERVPRRLAGALPDIRLVFVLRDPADRTYSQYRHMLMRGMTCSRFEDAVLERHTLLKRSCYEVALRRFLDHFPSEQIHLVRFEDVVVDPVAAAASIAEWLGLDASSADVRPRTHFNRGGAPRSDLVQRAANQLWGRRLARHRLDTDPPRSVRALRVVERAHRRLNHRVGGVPPMDPATHRWLDGHLAAENEGLGELVPWDPRELWYTTLEG